MKNDILISKKSKKALKVTFLGILVFSLLAGGAGALTSINSCGTLSTADTYQLTVDITYSGTGNCIEIAGSNVILDGQGHTITGPSTGSGKGINVARGLQYVQVKNLKLTNWDTGIYWNNTQFGTIDSNIINSRTIGIWFEASDANNIINNNISTHAGNPSGFTADMYLGGNGFKRNIIYNNIFADSTVFASPENLGSLYNGWNYYNCGPNGCIKELIPGPNIVGGPLIGGNFWGKSDGTGFSQQCTSTINPGICDNTYTVDSQGPNIDYYPLAKFSSNTNPPGNSIPEFPTIALPVVSAIGLLFIISRRKK